MAGNVYVDRSGHSYTAAAAADPADQMKVTVDPVLLTVLTAQPADEIVVKKAFLLAKQATDPKLGTGGKRGGWLWGILFLLAALSWSGEAKAQASSFHLLSGASDNWTVITSGAGAVWDIQAINTTATPYYLRLIDTVAIQSSNQCASSATLPNKVIFGSMIPAQTTGNGMIIQFPVGKAYGQGLAVCLTANASDTDDASAATGMQINFDYR